MAEKHEGDTTRAERSEQVADEPEDNGGVLWDEWMSTLPESTRRGIEAMTSSPLPPSTEADASPPDGVGAKKPKRDKNQPGKDRQNDIVAAILDQGVPLQRDEIREAMRLKVVGKLGHNLAWMVKNGVLVNIPGQGYWPAGREVPM